MLRMICGKTLKDKMNNEKIREMTGVVKLEEFLREKRLRWLGHVERMDEESGPVKALLLEVDGTKKGRLKKSWKEVLECDMTARGLQRLDAQDRERWRLGCKNQLTPACREPLLGSRNKKETHSWSKMMIMMMSVAEWVKASFYNDPNRMVWVQPAPWSRCCFLG